MTERSSDARDEDVLPTATVLDPHKSGVGESSLRPTGTVVLLIAGAADRRWAADAAIELGTAWARGGRRIVLADLHLEHPILHVGLDVSNLEGVVDIFLYGASLSRIAQPVRGGTFYLIPAGTYATDVGEVYRHPRWKKLVAGFKDTDAALLLFVPAHSADLEALGRWSSEAILLGSPPDATFVDGLRRAGLTLLGVLEPPGTTAADPTLMASEAREVGPPEGPGTDAVPAGSADAAAREPGGSTSPGPIPQSARPADPALALPPPPIRRRHERRGASAVLWILFAIILIGIVAYLVATLRPDLLPRFGPTNPSENGAAGAAALGPQTGPSRMGELLPYSVQVKAFTSLSAAHAELEAEQRRLPSTPFFISPEEIQGILYFRILSGLATDTLGARTVRDRLVATGAIDPEDAAGTWSLIQFTPLAFDLGEYPTAEAATLRADSLMDRQIPTYSTIVPYSDGSRRWHVYGGAFRDSVSASSMRAMLETAGLQASLTARTGLAAPRAE